MEQALININDIISEKPKTQLKLNKSNSDDNEKFHKIFRNKLNDNEDNNAKENQGDIQNIISFLQKILEQLNLEVSTESIENIKSAENYAEAKKIMKEMLLELGISDEEVKKILSDIENIKFKKIVNDETYLLSEQVDKEDLKSEAVNEMEKTVRNAKDTQHISKVLKNGLDTKLVFDKKKLLSEHFLNINKINFQGNKQEIDFRSDQSLLFHSNSQDNNVLVKNEIKVEKPTDILKFVDYLKMTNIKGGQKIVVKLHPEHLGNLKIEISDVSGKLTAKLFVESHEAKNLLVTQTDLIRQHLEAKGINLSNIDFGYLTDDSSKEQFNHRDTKNGFKNGNSAADRVTINKEKENYSNALYA
ncbi:flagellar hook-length control protein FliK [Deferribacter autotrophicus]|uniref:Flagellar hook-length control protein FliK n=1 Tax=Deferribacter autotrophicus TaxID=500465 RepID=A0A5A8F8E0_9BACT|nr:flagellar hook-length control protein FliK [Deferribacter autotrophicus]KAA0258423.1 flagellar hook-length control protein FliK [Deferribacter autotrophicus]